MKNRFITLLVFLAAFTITTPAFAGPPAADEKAATDEKADDAKADDAKAEEKAEEKADEKAEEKSGDGGDAEAKSDEKSDDGVIETDEEAVEAAHGLVGAIQQKHWALALGLGLSLLVFGLRKAKVLAKVPSKALPWVTAALGIVGYIAVALQGGGDIMDAVWGGAVTGVAAVGLWEMILKNFLGSKSSEGASGA